MQREPLRVFAYNSTFEKEEFNYKDDFYMKLIDIYVNCAGRMIGAHKFILANRSSFYREQIMRKPDIAILDVGFSYEMLALTMNIIYGESVSVKEDEVAELTRTCGLLGLSFTIKFPRDHMGSGDSRTLTSGSFPSDVAGRYATPTRSLSLVMPSQAEGSSPTLSPPPLEPF